MGRDTKRLVTLQGGDDGQSSVLGVVLMMGFVAAAAVSVFVVGTATVAETRDTAQEQQVENTFKQFNKDVASVAYGRQKYRSMRFDIEDQTAAFRQEDTGNIKVVKDGTTIVDEDVGSLVYENKGETIAYQAGGVWRGTGEDSRMVSRPPVEYQNGSLTFPIPALDGDDQIHAGKLDINKRKTESPVNNVGYIEGELVTLYITSEHYMGWAEYFRTQTNDVAVSVNHSLSGDKGRVKVKLGQPVANGDFQDGVMATGGDEGDIWVDGDNTDDSLAATGEITGEEGEENVESNLYELDEAIQRKVNKADEVTENDSDDSIEAKDLGDEPEITESGTYYDDDGFVLDEDLEIDVSDGNVTLIVDGNITIDNGDLDVTGTSSGNVVRVYSTGNYSHKNGHVGPSFDDSAKHFQFYGTSGMLAVIEGGSTEFVGTIYAPRNEPVLDPSGDEGEPNPVAPTSSDHCNGWDMCISTGSSEFKGAIVGGPTYMGQATSVDYDSTLSNVKPTLELDEGVLPPPITFLKVSVHTVAVNNSGANSIQPAGGFGASASVIAPPTPTKTGFASTAGHSGALVAPTARSAPLQ